MNPMRERLFAPRCTDPYPPFAPGAAVRLQAAGATIPAFTLDSAGIEPLAFAGSDLTMTNGQAFAFTWTPPATAGGARIFVKAEIGHHGGVAAAIECDLPDTGSGEIPAALVSALIAEGVHGFPTLSLTRRTIVSDDRRRAAASTSPSRRPSSAPSASARRRARASSPAIRADPATAVPLAA